MSDAPETPAPDPTPDPKAPESYYQKEAREKQEHAAKAAEIEADLLNSSRYDEFFAPYQPVVRVDFARSYTNQKMLWLRFGDFYARHLTGQLSQFENEAYQRLWDIQQKKLFDLQCQWRAELVQVPGVEVSCDFGLLAASIENSPVIPPITPAELDLYLAWVEQANYEEDLTDRWGGRFGWQNYDDVKAAYADEETDDFWAMEDVPEWYFFHNERTGNERLLQLPNLRGNKEEHYLDAWRDDNSAASEARQADAPPPPPPDPRPSYLDSEMSRTVRDEFARQFESAQLNRRREAYQAANRPSKYEDEELERVLSFLKELDEPVAIEAGPDWRLALRQAAYTHRKQKLLAHLPLAYEAYCQRQEWGIAHPPASSREYHGVGPIIREGILKGRELLGEPRDFNF
jgi:hypothetical protein